jgi:hypothetical protein
MAPQTTDRVKKWGTMEAGLWGACGLLLLSTCCFSGCATTQSAKTLPGHAPPEDPPPAEQIGSWLWWSLQAAATIFFPCGWTTH